MLRWITGGHDEAAIREALATLHPGIDPETVLKAAVGELRSDGNIDPQLMRGWALRAYRDLYRRCLEIGDFDGARKVMKEIIGLAK